MTNFGPSDTLHRLIKQTLDSGEVASLDEADTLFRSYRLHLAIGHHEAQQCGHQIALLTAVALARRAFLGGVSVSIASALNVPLIAPLRLGRTLRQAVLALGGEIVPAAEFQGPRITIGGPPQPRGSAFHVRTTFEGWRGGIVPAHSELGLVESTAMPLAPMLAAALGINEAFQHVRGEAVVAGRRAVGMSLWCPDPAYDWQSSHCEEPALRLLPSRLWLIGLGHLGQAYLWALGLLPYTDSGALKLVLQDVDNITPSTESTSILSDAALIGQKKTRAMAAWAERRGFEANIQERWFDASFWRQPTEPEVALCGLDNAAGRRCLDQVGFKLVVEAGLGGGFRNYRTLRVHTLPGSRGAAEIWRATAARDSVVDRAAYGQLLSSGALDRCGLTLLAGKAVGAPFVGAVAASLVVAEVLRLLHGGPLYQLVDIDLQSVESRSTVLQTLDFSTFNPGYSLVA